MERNGLNSTDIPEKSSFRIIVDELLSPFYVFQIFSLTLWYYDDYYTYASVILASSIMSIIMELREAKNNIHRLREISKNVGECKILRDN